MAALPTNTVPSRSSKAQFASRLFGYDVFISFALGGPPRGSQSYASDLARRLREHDLTVFFSEDELSPGQPLSDTLTRALLRSRLLVVIVNRGTLAMPNWVRTEVETFRNQRPTRPVIPVCVDDGLREKTLLDLAATWLIRGDSVWLEEKRDSAANGLATDELVQRVLLAPRRIKANTLWRIATSGVGFSLVALTIAAVLQSQAAIREREETLSRQLAAQSGAALVRDPSLALLLAAESQTVAKTPASDGALIGTLAALPVARMQQHNVAFKALALPPHGDGLLLTDIRGGVFRGELGTSALEMIARPMKGFKVTGALKALAFAPDGQSWARSSLDFDLGFAFAAGLSFNFDTGPGRAVSTAPKVAHSTNGKIVVHGPLGVSSLDVGDAGSTVPSYAHKLAFSPDGKLLAAVSSANAVRVFNLTTGTSRLLLRSQSELKSIAFSRDGRWLAVGGARGFLQALAVMPGGIAPSLQGDASRNVVALSFDAAGERLFAASGDGHIDVFDSRDGRRLNRWDMRPDGDISAMAVSHDGRFVVVGGSNGAVRLWLWVTDGAGAPYFRQSHVVLRHADAVHDLAFANDGLRLVSIGNDGRLFVTLPLDLGRWQQRAGAPPATPTSVATAASVTRGVSSSNGRWTAWFGTSAPLPDRSSMASVDMDTPQRTDYVRLTVVDNGTGRVTTDGSELPGTLGELIVTEPVFSADSDRLAVQVSGRLMFWDLPTSTPLDAAVPLPPISLLADNRYIAATTAGHGWIVGAGTTSHYVLETDPNLLASVACRLSGRQLTPEEWRRYVGNERAYAPACGKALVAEVP